MATNSTASAAVALRDRSSSIVTSVENSQLNDAEVRKTRFSSNSTTPTQCEFANIDSIHSISTAARDLIKVITELSFHRIDDVVQLPKIVVVGDQSAGKSSLIEAITGITVPRDSGTCTRCPIHVSLTEADAGVSWSCKIILEKSYHYNHKNGSYGIWERKTKKESISFANVTRPEDMEEMIHRAQLAMLNPNREPESFLSVDIRTTGYVHEISPNVVRLDICGPALHNLSFFDLPGVIHTVKSGEPNMPTLVLDLIREYLKPESNIILLAARMSEQMEGCAAKQLVQEADAERRCIGVLTKPDLLPAGASIDSWQKVLIGIDHVLEYGYHVTKQPDQKQKNQGITHAQALAAEQEFFETQEPWTTDFLLFRERCGIANLQRRLSEVLVVAIKKCIPNVRHQIATKLDEITTQLSTLPEAPGNDAMVVVYSSIDKIEHSIETAVQGQYPDTTFILLWQKLAKAFQKEFEKQRPVLDVHRQSIVLSDDDSDVVSTPSPGKRAMQPKASPIKKQKMSSGQAQTPGPLKIRLQDIRKRLEEVSPPVGLHHKVDSRAATVFVVAARKLWSEITYTFVKQTMQLLQQQIDCILDKYLMQWKTSPFYERIKHSINKFICDRVVDLRGNIQYVLDTEMLEPFTFDNNILSYRTREVLAHLMESRRETEIESLAFKETPTKGKNAKRFVPPAAEGFDDPFKNEVEVMAMICGYYDHASSGLIDQVCKSIRHDLFEHCRRDLKSYLIKNLDICGEDATTKCKKLLEHDQEVAKQREELLAEKKKYEDAKGKLDNI